MDRREAILERLVAIADALPGVAAVLRNTPKLDDTARPAVVILDADEAVETAPEGPRRSAGGPILIAMTPQVFIHATGEGENAGPIVNQWRAAWLKAVLLDPVLKSLVGPNGSIRYAGAATGFGWGREYRGEIGIEIAFVYPLNLSDL
jgi:hypothetical protein